MRTSHRSLLTGLLLAFLPASGSAAPTVADQLQELHSHYAMLSRAKADFQTARAQGTLTSAEESEFTSWITQLNDRVLQDCIALKNTSEALPQDLPCEQLQPGRTVPAAIDLSAELTEAEKTGQMVGQLNHSLGEFDESLLREQARVKAKTPYTDPAGNTASGSGTATSENGTDQGETAQTTGETGNQGENQATRTVDGESQGEQATGRREGKPGKATPGGSGDIPDDIPDGSDDDRKRRTRQIRARVVSRHFECGGEVVTLTLSMGTVIRPPNPPGTEANTKDIADDIIRRLSTALDKAKKQGGDQVVDDDGSAA